MARYDYRCTCGTVTDTFRPMSCEAITCPSCGSTATRIISRGAAVAHPHGDISSAVSRLMDDSYERDYIQGRHEIENGQPVSDRHSWEAAGLISRTIEHSGSHVNG